MLDFMKLLSGGIKKGEGSLISQIKSMAAKVQQGMEGISSFSLPELTLPHFDGSGWNFSQAALAGGGRISPPSLHFSVSPLPFCSNTDSFLFCTLAVHTFFIRQIRGNRGFGKFQGVCS